MLWTTNSTLKCRRSSSGIHAEISGIRYIDSIVFGLFAAFSIPFMLVDGNGTSGHHPTSLGEIAGVFLLAGLAAAFAIYHIKSGCTIVTLDAETLIIERHRFGMVWSSRRFPTSTVRNLGYLPPKPPPFFSRSRGLPGEICFDSGKKTIRFGAGIDYDDAKTLIFEMNQVWKFPWDLTGKSD